MQGWVKLHRKIILSEIYVMPPLYLRVFERLVIEANHKDKEVPFSGKKKLVKKGQRITSLRNICQWVGWNERGTFRVPAPQTISNILKWLQEQGMITVETSSCFTLYSVLNYSIYQEIPEEEKTVNGQKVDTNKNDKNVKNKDLKDDKQIYEDCILLSPIEHQKLIDKYNITVIEDYISRLNCYLLNNPKKKYASHYATLLNWLRRDNPQLKKESEPISAVPKGVKLI